AFVVEAERAERTRDRRIDGDVHQLRPVRHRSQPAEVEPGRAGVRGLPAEDAIELDGVADGLVDLERELFGAEDQRRLAARARWRGEQLPGLRSDPRRLSSEVERLHELPPLRAVVPARRRVGATLRLPVADGRRHDPGAALADVLLDAMPLAGDEPLAGLPQLVEALRQVGAV